MNFNKILGLLVLLIFICVNTNAQNICPNIGKITKDNVCSSYSSPSGKYIWTKPGIYYDTLILPNYCDSVIEVTLLTVKSASLSRVSIEECYSYKAPNGKEYTRDGTYQITLTNREGCDSIVTIDLTLKNTIDIINASFCDKYVSKSKKIWTQTGTYYDTVPNSSGCFEITTYNLISNKNSSSVDITHCDSYLSPSFKYTWDKSGIYFDTVKNRNKCDSVIIINLTINKSERTDIKVTACDFYISPVDGKKFTKSGISTNILKLSNGCDSLIVFDITLNFKSLDQTIKVSQCNNYKWFDEFYRNSGIYDKKLKNKFGCDSILYLDLTIMSENYNSNKSDYLVCTTTDQDQSKMLAFTPNNDGLNDNILFILPENTNKKAMTIFDQFGKEIYNAETRSSFIRWDGKQNQIIRNGTYFYVIEDLTKNEVISKNMIIVITNTY